MPFALLIIGLFLLIAGIRNTAGPASSPTSLFGLIHGDFTGTDNFIYWFLAILIIGALGYVPKLKPVSTGLIVLVIVVLFLKKGNSSGVGGGFFSQFTNAINGSTNSGVTTATGTSAGTTAAQNLQRLQNQIDSVNQQILHNLDSQQASI